MEYLADLPEKVPTTANAEKYIKIVEEKSTLRKLIKTSTAIIEESYNNGGDVEKVIDIYAEHGQGRERLGNYIDRIGLEEFKKQLNIEEFLNA